MSIKKIKYCNDHSKEKEKDGECCQTKDEQDNAHALTYENETKRSNNE
jgi:hypothetical protein